MRQVHSFPLTTIAWIHSFGPIVAETNPKSCEPLLLPRIACKLSLLFLGRHWQAR